MMDTCAAAGCEGHELPCVVNALADTSRRLMRPLIGQRPYMISVCGDGALGKSTLARALAAALDRTEVVETDGYILDRARRRELGIKCGDDPQGADLVALANAVRSLRDQDGVAWVCEYDHATGTRGVGRSVRASDNGVVIVEGNFAMWPTILPLLDYSVFLSASLSTRYGLRREVDTQER